MRLNKSKNNFLWINLVLILIISLGVSGCTKEPLKEAKQEDQRINRHEVVKKPVREERETYEIFKKDDANKFVNKVDGYSILIPKNMTIDMTMSEIRATFENKNDRIEIYKQPLTGDVTAASYNKYSNGFLENEVDHDTVHTETVNMGGRTLMISEWSRPKLKHMKNDRNHYASVDMILDENTCMTFFFKSKAPFSTKGENKRYMAVVESFQLESATKKPYFKTVEYVKNPNWNEETESTFKKYFGKDAKLTWGIFERHAPADFGPLEKIEEKLDFKFPILLYYTGFYEYRTTHPDLAKSLKAADEKGKLLELTLQTHDLGKGRGNMIYNVLNGDYDVFLKNYAQDIVNYGKPVLFRLGNEMNGDWCVYSAYHTSKDTEIYKAFYEYIYSIFEEVKADNVIWIWNPNGKSFPDFKWNNELCYYPGDTYVDVVGMTNYNTGTYYKGEKWFEFTDLYDNLYRDYVRKYKKPLMITEFASSSVGGNKEKWVQTMFDNIGRYDKLKVAIWWSSRDLDTKGNVARPYYIDETEAVTERFKEGIK